MATPAKAKAPVDPLADLREVTPANAPERKATEQAATPPETPEQEATGHEATTNIGKTVAAIVLAWHQDRFLASGLHKGGTCQCVRLAHVALARTMDHVIVVPLNSEEGTGAA